MRRRKRSEIVAASEVDPKRPVISGSNGYGLTLKPTTAVAFTKRWTTVPQTKCIRHGHGVSCTGSVTMILGATSRWRLSRYGSS